MVEIRYPVPNMKVARSVHPDNGLVAALRNKEADVIRSLYQEHFPLIEHLVVSNSGSKDDALDLFQDGMMVIYRKSRDGDLELTCSFKTYLFSICRNLWLKRLRKNRNLEVTILTDEESIDTENLETTFDEQERYRFFKSKLNRLGPDCQQVMTLFFEGISMIRIAEIMGYASEGYAKKRKFKCKEKLVELIKNDPAYNEWMEP